MRAVVYEAFQQPPFIQTVADPVPDDDGVVLRVMAAGLCRSDWHGWMGHDPDIRLPHVPGHELAGQVVAAGKNVQHWRIGDRVTVPFVGSHGMQAHRYPQMMAMIDQGKLSPESLVGEMIGLEDALPALVNMHKFDNAGVTVINRF